MKTATIAMFSRQNISNMNQVSVMMLALPLRTNKTKINRQIVGLK